MGEDEATALEGEAQVETTEVHCYSGHEYAERPVSFSWEGEEHKVQTVEKEWLEPGRKRFRVRTGDGRTFELCYDMQQDQWSVAEFV